MEIGVAATATVEIYLAVVEFDDVVTDMVEEVAVVGHHQNGQPLFAEEVLQPFDHGDVEVVGRLVEQQQVGVVDEYAAQRHFLLFAAAEGVHGTIHEFVDLQAGEHFADALFKVPGFHVLRAFGRFDKTAYRLVGVEVGILGQIGHLGVATEGDLAAVGQFLAGDDVEQGAFAVSVAGDEGGLLSGVDAEADVFEQQLVAKRFGEVFYGQ